MMDGNHLLVAQVAQSAFDLFRRLDDLFCHEPPFRKFFNGVSSAGILKQMLEDLTPRRCSI